MFRAISEADAYRLALLAARADAARTQLAALEREHRALVRRLALPGPCTVVTEPDAEYPVGTLLGPDGRPVLEEDPPAAARGPAKQE